jgi:hypothetical protein
MPCDFPIALRVPLCIRWPRCFSFVINHISKIQPTTAFLKVSSHCVPARRDNDIIRASEKALAPYVLQNFTGIDAVCDFSAVKPDCLRTLYGTVEYTPQVPGENRVGLNNCLGQTTNRSDTQIFLAKFRPEATACHGRLRHSRLPRDNCVWYEIHICQWKRLFELLRKT